MLRRVDDGAGARLVEDEGLDESALLRHQRVPERHVAAVGAVARRAEEAGARALEHEVRRLLRVALHRLRKGRNKEKVNNGLGRELREGTKDEGQRVGGSNSSNDGMAPKGKFPPPFLPGTPSSPS